MHASWIVRGPKGNPRTLPGQGLSAFPEEDLAWPEGNSHPMAAHLPRRWRTWSQKNALRGDRGGRLMKFAGFARLEIEAGAEHTPEESGVVLIEAPVLGLDTKTHVGVL